MGSPAQKNQKYLDTIKRLEDACKDLASQYSLNAYSTSHLFQFPPDQMGLFPPGDGQILLRDSNSQLVASVEPDLDYDPQQDSLVIKRVVMRIYESTCNGPDKIEALANSFYDKYTPKDDFDEKNNQGLEGMVYVVKESTIFNNDKPGKENDNQLPSIKVSFDHVTYRQLESLAADFSQTRAQTTRKAVRFTYYMMERVNEGYKIAFLKEEENPRLLVFVDDEGNKST